MELIKKKRKSDTFFAHTTQQNISPSGDPYWNNPQNVQTLYEYDRLKAEGKMTFTRLTPELKKELFGK